MSGGSHGAVLFGHSISALLSRENQKAISAAESLPPPNRLLVASHSLEPESAHEPYDSLLSIRAHYPPLQTPGQPNKPSSQGLYQHAEPLLAPSSAVYALPINCRGGDAVGMNGG